jgi:hypothetical protein
MLLLVIQASDEAIGMTQQQHILGPGAVGMPGPEYGALGPR